MEIVFFSCHLTPTPSFPSYFANFRGSMCGIHISFKLYCCCFSEVHAYVIWRDGEEGNNNMPPLVKFYNTQIEIKPYVLNGQLCDECHGVQSDGKPAPIFCCSMSCLKYYCENCWVTVHSMPNWQNHHPHLKDVGDHVQFH